MAKPAQKTVTRREFWSQGLSFAGWGSLFTLGTGSVIESVRFFAPTVVFSPPTTFEVGHLDDFNNSSLPDHYGIISVESKWKQEHRFFILREEQRLYALLARCTHLGCTINWFPGLGIFKCPCHGSQFYSDGTNFAGPAPRPLDRLKIAMNSEGNIVVDTGVVYSRDQFEKKKAYIQV